VPDAHRPLALDRQAHDPASILAAYRGAIADRKAHPALATGSLTFLASGDEDILAFVREGGGERLLCLFNFAREARRWTGEGANVDLPPLGYARIPLG
jgi:alpha-glucosidase